MLSICITEKDIYLKAYRILGVVAWWWWRLRLRYGSVVEVEGQNHSTHGLAVHSPPPTWPAPAPPPSASLLSSSTTPGECRSRRSSAFFLLLTLCCLAEGQGLTGSEVGQLPRLHGYVLRSHQKMFFEISFFLRYWLEF